MAAAGSSAAWKRWLRPEVYPIFAATGVAVSICAMQLIRNITTNPEVRYRPITHACLAAETPI